MLDFTLKQMGLIKSKEICIVFTIKLKAWTIYVDDLILFTNNQKSKSYIKEELHKRFIMKDLG